MHLEGAPGGITHVDCERFGPYRDGVYDDVEAEVEEQEERWGVNLLRAEQADGLWLSVLTEEVGEVAREICEGWGTANIIRLRSELIQVAAVAISWLEALVASERNCVICCNYEESPEERDCPKPCPVLLAEKLRETGQ